MKKYISILILSIISVSASANKFVIANKIGNGYPITVRFYAGKPSDVIVAPGGHVPFAPGEQSSASIKDGKLAVYDRGNITGFAIMEEGVSFKHRANYNFTEADANKDLMFIVKIPKTKPGQIASLSFQLDKQEMPSGSKPEK